MEQDERTQKRLQELARTAYQREYVTFSDFLDLHQLHLLHSLSKKELGVDLRLFGGYDLAERQMASFIPDAFSYEIEFPMKCLRIRPLSAKYAEALTHRDYLGAVLNLGVDRCKIGDIVVMEKEAWMFCTEGIAPFLSQELCRVRHTSVQAEILSQWEEFPGPRLREITGTVASVRLDTVISLAFSSSRSSLIGLIEGGKVQVNGVLITSNGYRLKDGDIISVRTMGKFRYDTTMYQTKKGRYSIRLYRYQ